MNRTLERSLWAIFAVLAALAVWATLRGPGWGFPSRDPLWLTIYALVAVLVVVHATWAIGAKTPISDDPHGIAAGVEIMGSFENADENWSVLPGVYMPLGGEQITLKTGLEFGKADGAEAVRANVTMMYRF